MSIYKWNGYEINFEHREELHQQMTKLFVEHTEHAKKLFSNNYKSQVKGKDENTVKAMIKLACDVLEQEIDGIKEDIRKGKYYIRFDDIYNKCEDEIYADISYINIEMFSAALEIKGIQSDMRDIREMRKQNQGRWGGGGFGLKGALKGVVEAEILNAATGMTISAVNAVGNFRTSIKTNRQMSQILDTGRDAIVQAITNGISVLFYACLEAKGLDRLYTKAMISSNELILKQYKDDKSESAMKYLFNNIKNNPYNIEQYKVIIKRYGDASGVFETMGASCGIDIKKIKTDILTSEFEGIKVSYGDERLRTIYLTIQKRKKELGFVGEFSKEMSIKKYLRDDLESELKSLMEQIKSGDEKNIDDAFEKIGKLKEEFDMVNGILEDILKKFAR